MAVWTSSQIIETYSNRRIDSEFFDPAYIKAETETLKCHTEKLGRLGYFFPGPFGSAFHVQNYDLKSPYRYIRGRDVKPFFLLDDDNRYIPESDFNRLGKYSVLPKDLMISVVGTLGNVAVCTDDDTPAVFSCKSTIFRGKEIDPYYLLAYLNSHYGRMCLLRRQRGAVQTGLNIEDLRAVPIPRFDDSIEKEIASLVKSSHSSAKRVKKSYAQAQHLLESELNLDKLKFKKPVGCTARCSETFTSGRFDADFFQFPFRQMHKHLDSIETERLSNLVDFIKGIEVGSNAYSFSGYPFLRVSNIKEKGIELGSSDKYISESTYHLLADGYQPRIGELLLTKDGTPGICCTVDENISGIISGGIIRLIPKINRIPIEYLALVINSKACRMQIEQECSGALILHWKPSSIRKLRIPLVRESRMQDIADLVISSKNVRRASIQFLNQAKTRVEQLIEKAAAR